METDCGSSLGEVTPLSGGQDYRSSLGEVAPASGGQDYGSSLVEVPPLSGGQDFGSSLGEVTPFVGRSSLGSVRCYYGADMCIKKSAHGGLVYTLKMSFGQVFLFFLFLRLSNWSRMVNTNRFRKGFRLFFYHNKDILKK